ncbi:MAG: aminoacyl-tRNA hydrolase [Burkholderiaceae bacterium]|jgi:PTH1 family peptidyl-tRNA hydrolase|nr:aminoacyl-tRNA hydrolase [Burkholderiaceae bacterium]
MSIRLIVGLGNPGPEYEQTRHNAGFWFIDNLAARFSAPPLKKESRFQALVSRARIAGQDVWLLEPQTFMNLSGEAVGAFARFYRIAVEDILVVHDELDIPPGTARLKKGGSTGGHRGLNDIVSKLGSQDFWRLRLGIGHPRQTNPKMAVIDYVLQRPGNEELDLISDAMTRALEIMPLMCEGKSADAMKTLHTAT